MMENWRSYIPSRIESLSMLIHNTLWIGRQEGLKIYLRTCTLMLNLELDLNLNLKVKLWIALRLDNFHLLYLFTLIT